ncbi:MAG: hypothetical protein EOM21_20740 [Gammaproteobacteria bacterium]|nr:hypothetical protein [Gammaproteobacteria bacterium]
MTTLKVDCFAAPAMNGSAQAVDEFLGQADITLDTASASANLPAGTQFVQLATDSTADVYFCFGTGTVTAVTTDQRMFASQGELLKVVGTNGRENNVIAAILAS